MPQAVTEIARQAMSFYENLTSFEATERITAGPISAEARVRVRRPDKVSVDYHTYRDPLAEFEEGFVGGAEFVADELVGMQLFYDGRGTWLYEPKNEVATYKPGKALYGPLPEANAIGELGFLRGLVHDFLFRDEGEGTLAGRPTRSLGLKPKERYRSFLLKEEAFPIERATLALDAETFFPLRIAFYPHSLSALSYLVRRGTPITIEYADVRLNALDERALQFAPLQGTRVFKEETVPGSSLAERLPFPLVLEAFEKHGGYRLYQDLALTTVNEEKDRGYALLTLVSPQGTADEPTTPPVLTLRVGNYLSHNMSRRRAFLFEHGDDIALGQVKARLVDRSALLKEHVPEAARRRILEVGWEKGGVHFFLLAEGLEKDALTDLVKALVEVAREGTSNKTA